jgi:protein PET100
MGGWKLEVFRMALYISFPVSLFYLFNKPEFFKEILIDYRKKHFPVEDPEAVSSFSFLIAWH